MEMPSPSRPLPPYGDYNFPHQGDVSPAERGDGNSGPVSCGNGNAYSHDKDALPSGYGELQDFMRREWAHFSRNLEDRLEIQFHRQAIRIESIVSNRGGKNLATLNGETKASGQVYLGNNMPEYTSVNEATASSSIPVNDATQTTEGSPTRLEQRRLSALERNLGFGGEPAGGAPASPPSASFEIAEAVQELRTAEAGGPARSASGTPQKAASLSWDNETSAFRKVTYHLFSQWIDWWLDLEEPPRTGRLAAFVDGKFFELLCAVVIAANSAVTVHATNYEADFLQPDTSLAMSLVNGGFVAFYCVELLLKILVHKLFFFCNVDMYWNIFDFVLVTFALYDIVFSEAMSDNSDSGGVNISYMRTMRILRLAKILRVVRVMRFFQELRLILNSILGSIISLFWSIVMLALMFFIFSLVFVQGATSALQNADHGISPLEKIALESYLGSVQEGMLMLYQACTGGDDWMNFYRSIQHTGDLNCALFLFFVAFAQFALLNILTGIFVENAMKLAQPDRDTLALQRRKEEVSVADELRRLCKAADPRKTGYITQQQFMQQLQSHQFKARLGVLGLDIKDAELFFSMISQGFEEQPVDIEVFVNGCMRLKGHASSLDLQTLVFGTRLIHTNQIRFHNSLESHLKKVLSRVGNSQ